MKLSINSNILELIQYFDDMSDQGFFELVKESYESADNLAAVLRMGLRIMKKVYDMWPDPGTRTMNLYNSVKVASDVNSAKMGSLALYSDPGIATSKGDPDFSYAAYFIDPEGLNTFIPIAGEQDYPRNFRPFFEKWEVLFDTMNAKMAEKALRNTLKALNPA